MAQDGIMPENKITPVIQKKQSWQKPNCLFCNKIAKFEAFASRGKSSSYIRCCESSICQKKAKDMSVESIFE